MRTEKYPPAYRRSPAEIRAARFSRRIRGINEYEVADFLDLLANQVKATAEETHTLRAANERLATEVEQLRAEVEQLRAQADRASSAETEPDPNPRAAAVILHAQELADALVEEAVDRTSEMLATARLERRTILRDAERAAAELLQEVHDGGVTRLRPDRSPWPVDRDTVG